ncbi:MAG: hypothetical protein KDA57_19150, partial [Planctomycetales bacterium]|nr:hypothetical protein [Planctomycetales bacterium]
MASTLQPSNKSTDNTIPAELLSAQSGSSRFWRDKTLGGVSPAGDWQAWSRHLAKRRSPKSLQRLCLTTEPPLLWGILLEELSPDSSSLLSLLQNFGDAPKGKSRPGIKLIKQTLAKWQQGTCSQPQTIDFALECLAVAHLLPRIAEELSSDAWWGLLDALWQVVQSSAGWRIDIELPPQEGLAQQLLAGELPLTLAYLLPEMRPVHKLHDAAHEALSEGVAELLNGEGLLRGTHLGVLRPLLACWTRCRTLGQVYKKKCWNQKAEDQFSCLATHAVALSSPAGAPMLGHPHAMPWTPDFLQNVLRWGGDGADIAAARYLFGKKLTRSLPQKRSKFVPETSDHCEWSGLAYLRTDWGRSEPTIVVDFSTPIMRIECWAGPQRLLSGTWTSETTLDGKRLEPVGTWDEVCWFSDEDVDYLELSIDLAGGATLERQILLAREELFLLLCDNVVGTRGGQLSHHYCLPLDANVAFEPCKE